MNGSNVYSLRTNDNLNDVGTASLQMPIPCSTAAWETTANVNGAGTGSAVHGLSTPVVTHLERDEREMDTTESCVFTQERRGAITRIGHGDMRRGLVGGCSPERWRSREMCIINLHIYIYTYTRIHLYVYSYILPKPQVHSTCIVKHISAPMRPPVFTDHATHPKPVEFVLEGLFCFQGFAHLGALRMVLSFYHHHHQQQRTLDGLSHVERTSCRTLLGICRRKETGRGIRRIRLSRNRGQMRVECRCKREASMR